MGIKDDLRRTFKYNNVAMVGKIILASYLKDGNECNASDKFSPRHMRVVCLVTYNNKIALKNKDGF